MNSHPAAFRKHDSDLARDLRLKPGALRRPSDGQVPRRRRAVRPRPEGAPVGAPGRHASVRRRGPDPGAPRPVARDLRPPRHGQGVHAVLRPRAEVRAGQAQVARGPLRRPRRGHGRGLAERPRDRLRGRTVRVDVARAEGVRRPREGRRDTAPVDPAPRRGGPRRRGRGRQDGEVVVDRLVPRQRDLRGFRPRVVRRLRGQGERPLPPASLDQGRRHAGHIRGGGVEADGRAQRPGRRRRVGVRGDQDREGAPQAPAVVPAVRPGFGREVLSHRDRVERARRSLRDGPDPPDDGQVRGESGGRRRPGPLVGRVSGPPGPGGDRPPREGGVFGPRLLPVQPRPRAHFWLPRRPRRQGRDRRRPRGHVVRAVWYSRGVHGRGGPSGCRGSEG
mmetsp:Transcript_18065/g.41507  ORF Transcript_18065/g.41507 Transcript_18065/m.41507 type:complete len:391 (-) Transcript_18065:248-1420(-)